MTKFEEMLIKKGYDKYILNCKIMKYEKAHISPNTISTMVNLDYRYFHPDDTNIIEKINKGYFVGTDGITFEDRKGEIIFGLREYKKPPTLCWPRPRIELKRTIDDEIVFEDGIGDDAMNIILSKIDHELIFQAMFDKTIILKLDLTENEN